MKQKITAASALILACLCSAAQEPPPDSAKAAQTSPPSTVAPATDIFTQAPAGIEEALRPRLNEFYECYLTGTFRKAYDLVAPDSKDAYFDAEKSTFHSYKISRIDFTDNYTKAKVMLIVNTDFKMQGHLMRVDVPMVANWKVVDGQWYWYVIPRVTGEAIKTPFGEIHPNGATSNKDASAAGKPAPKDPKSMVERSSAMPLLVKPVLTLNSANNYADKTQLVNRSRQKVKFQVESEPITGLVIDPPSAEMLPGSSVTIKAQFISKTPPTGPKVMHPAYISVAGGFRMQFYVAIESSAPVTSE